MDNRFTNQLQDFFNTPEEERDYDKGALMLLQITGNKIMYRNISFNAKKHAKFINYELRKHFNVRLQKITHEEVEQMQAQVNVIVAEHLSLTEDNPAGEFKKGKRTDHDTLPDEIQALYVENLSITQRMRDVQTQLRLLSVEGKTCPDNDRYPYLKELISLDKKLHENWEKYDHYVGTAGSGAVALSVDIREESKKYTRLVNLNKGKYKKSPTEELKIQIVDWFGKIVNPTEKLTAELKELGIIS